MKLGVVPWDGVLPPTESELRRRLAADGFAVMRWSDPPHHTYTPHQHDHDESLCGVHGLIIFQVNGGDFRLGPGDRLMLPRGTVHGATVGADGATYLIGERS